MKNSRTKKLFAVLITIILVAILLTQISLSEVIATLLSIEPVYVLAGFMLYTGTYVLRSWRFHILLNRQVSTGDLFPIECVHNMFNNLLPVRSGELSYVYLLRSEQNKTTGEALGTLIIARIFDFIIITIFFLLLFLCIENLAPGFTILVVIGIIFLVAMVVLLAGLLFCGDAILIRIKKCSEYLNFEKIQPGTWITKKSEETIACFNIYKAGTIHTHLSVIVLSLGIWAFSYLLFYLLAVSMHIELGIIPILFASSFAVFSTVLPIQGIGGFGTMEAGWALGFIAVGLEKDIAINTGFGFHLIVLLYTVLLGVFGYLSMYRSRKEKQRD